MQEKSEQPFYHRDVAKLIKQQLDTTKGYIYLLYLYIYNKYKSSSITYSFLITLI